MLKILFKISVIIFVTEFIVMVGLAEIEENLAPIYLVFLDATLLAILSIFPIYYWVVRPYVLLAGQSRSKHKKKSRELEAIVEAVLEGIITIEANGTITMVNPAAEQQFGYDHGELIGQNVKILMTSDHSIHHDQYLTKHAGAEKARILGTVRKLVGKRKDKSLFPIEISIKEMKVSGGRMYTSIIRDLTDENEFTDKLEQQVVELEFQRQAIEEAAQSHVSVMEELAITKEELIEKNVFMHEIMEHTGQGVLVFNSHLLLAAWNKEFREILCFKDCECFELMPIDKFLDCDNNNVLIGKLTIEEYISKLKQRIDGRDKQNEFIWDKKLEDGKILHIVQRIMDDGSIVFMLRDVTKERLEAEHIKTMALKDALTGLANRRAFDVQLDKMIQLYKGQKSPFLLAFMDIDNFKAVNDTHGHGVGDAALKFVAGSIERHIRETDMATRLGGDEFAIIFKDTDDTELAVQRLDCIIDEIKALDTMDGYAINIGASAGLASCSMGGAEGSDLMELADKALYRAKEKGKGQVSLAKS